MSNKTLTLCVIIPTYNEEDYIGDCLQAIADQSEPPESVIVVDNNSTDKTVDIVKKYPFATLLHEKKQGVRFARNRGFNASKEDIIGRIDADTRLEPDWCRHAREIFSRTADVSAATGPCSYYDMPLERVSLKFDKALRRVVFTLGDMPVLYGSNMLIRRSAWTDIRDDLCMSGEIYEDYDISIHLADNGYITVYDKHLIAAVSARRLDDGPRSFARNMRLHTHTFAVHGMTNRIATMSRLGYLSVYPTLKVVRTLYDSKRGRMSIKKAISDREQARPDSKNY